MVHRGPGISENQLLKLIQNPKEALTNKEIGRRVWQSFFSFSALKARALFLVEQLKHPVKKDGFDLKQILRGSLAALFVILVVNVAMGWRSVYRMPQLSFNKKTGAEFSVQTAPSKSISEYLNFARNRDLFRFGSAESIGDTPTPKQVGSTENEESSPLDNLALVGISFSEDPDVMIKDNTTQEVYFLKRGDRIGKKMRIEAILKDRVIISYQGKEIELQ